MTKKNYIQTIESYNPQRLFTFSDINSYISYNGKDIEGAIFDENTNAILEPVLTYLKTPPKEVKLFGPSVIENEITNQSLSISGVSADYPFNVAYISHPPAAVLIPKSSFSVQFKVPKQPMNNETVITGYSSPVGKITTDTGITVTIPTVFRGDYWYLPITTNDLDLLTVKKITIEMSYKGQVFHTDEYYIETTEYGDRFDGLNGPNGIYALPHEDLRPVFNDVMSRLPLKYTDGPIADFIWGYGSYRGSPTYMVNDYNTMTGERRKVIYGVEDIVFYGTIKERIEISTYENNTKGTNPIKNRSTTIAICSGINASVYNDNQRLLLQITHEYRSDAGDAISDMSHIIPITDNTNYTLVITKEFKEKTSLIRVYLNSVLQVTKESMSMNSFNTSQIRIGNPDSIRSVVNYNTYIGFWNGAYLTYYHNSVTIFIDNVAVINDLLTQRDIYLMYIRTMTYKKLLSTFNPIFHTVFDKPVTKYVNEYGTDMLVSNNFNISPVEINSEVYPTGVKFKGTGSLLHTYSSNNNTKTTSLINFNLPFSLVFWFKTNTRNFLLYSERNQSNIANGLSVFVEDGYVTYKYRDVKRKTTCFVSDGRFRMLGISYDGANLKTFVPKEHNSTYTAVLYDSNISPRYVTLLNDKGVDTNVDITICAFSAFNKVLDTQQFTDLYNENIDFSVVGTVLFENLPAYSQVRIIEHSSGKLLDVQYTDVEGRFKYTSIYKNDIDIVTLNNGRLQAVGTIQATTR